MTDIIDLVAVGAGKIFTEYHLPALLSTQQFRVVGVVDLNVRAADTVAKSIGAIAYSNIDDVPGADLCLVTTPPNIRAQIIAPALTKGMSVLCEKPICFDSDEAEQFLSLCESGRQLMVAQTRRFFPNIILLRSLLASRFFGSSVQISIVEGAPLNWSASSTFRTKPTANDGGVIHDEGAHVFDIASCFLSDLGAQTSDIKLSDVLVDSLEVTNSCNANIKAKIDDCEVEIAVSVSRSEQTLQRIVVSGDRCSVETRSLYSSDVTLVSSSGERMQLIPPEAKGSGVEDAFARLWHEAASTIKHGASSIDMSLTSVMPTLSLIDSVMEQKKLGLNTEFLRIPPQK